jgi:hypothetical protein
VEAPDGVAAPAAVQLALHGCLVRDRAWRCTTNRLLQRPVLYELRYGARQGRIRQLASHQPPVDTSDVRRSLRFGGIAFQKWSGTSELHGSSPIRTEYAAITTRARERRGAEWKGGILE